MARPTCSNDLLNLHERHIDLLGELSHRLIGVLVGEGVNVDLHPWRPLLWGSNSKRERKPRAVGPRPRTGDAHVLTLSGRPLRHQLSLCPPEPPPETLIVLTGPLSSSSSSPSSSPCDGEQPQTCTTIRWLHSEGFTRLHTSTKKYLFTQKGL